MATEEQVDAPLQIGKGGLQGAIELLSHGLRPLQFVQRVRDMPGGIGGHLLTQGLAHGRTRQPLQQAPDIGLAGRKKSP